MTDTNDPTSPAPPIGWLTQPMIRIPDLRENERQNFPGDNARAIVQLMEDGTITPEQAVAFAISTYLPRALAQSSSYDCYDCVRDIASVVQAVQDRTPEGIA